MNPLSSTANSEVGDGFRHQFETVDGLRIHYVTKGIVGDDVLVLLAGYPQSWFAWRKVMPILSERFHVIAVDLPGQGDSDKPLDGYDTATVARRVHGLLEQLGIKKYGLVAHDVGAWVAFTYALMFPTEISRLVLMDAGIPGVTLPDMLPTAPDRAWRTWHFSFHAIPDFPEEMIAGKERIYLDWFLRRKAVSPFSFNDQDVDEYLRVFTLPGALRAGLAFYRSVSQSAEQNRGYTRDAKLAMPLLALTADQGSIPDMTEPLGPFADAITGETIARCGHFIPEEQPAAAADAIIRFFAG